MKCIFLTSLLLLVNVYLVQTQDFDNPLINPYNLTTEGARSSPLLSDIDNDGDLDLFTGYVGGEFGFYENMGTPLAPSFDTVIFTPFGLTNLSGDCAPFLVDLDGDGDLDMMAGSDSGLRYFENQGNVSTPSFGPAVVNPFGILDPPGNLQPSLADIDQDGDFDLFVGATDGNLYFFTNTGTAGNPSFAVAQTNPFGLSNSGSRSSPDLVDIDSDGDLDMVVGNQSGQFRYYENTGSVNAPSFNFITENPFNLSSVGQDAKPHFADIDADGDYDLISGNALGEYYFFENIAPLGSSDQQPFTAIIYPNPVSSFAYIHINGLQWSQAEFLLLDIQGRIVFSKSDCGTGNTITFFRNELSPGVYIAYLKQRNSHKFLGKLVLQ
jgi:hypothetical protein